MDIKIKTIYQPSIPLELSIVLGVWLSTPALATLRT